MNLQILVIRLLTFSYHVDCERLCDDKNVQQKVVEYFASFDEHIKDFRVERFRVMVNQRKKNIRLMRFIRRLILMKWQRYP